jgi:hypothetical protein
LFNFFTYLARTVSIHLNQDRSLCFITNTCPATPQQKGRTYVSLTVCVYVNEKMC